MDDDELVPDCLRSGSGSPQSRRTLPQNGMHQATGRKGSEQADADSSSEATVHIRLASPPDPGLCSKVRGSSCASTPLKRLPQKEDPAAHDAAATPGKDSATSRQGADCTDLQLPVAADTAFRDSGQGTETSLPEQAGTAAEPGSTMQARQAGQEEQTSGRTQAHSSHDLSRKAGSNPQQSAGRGQREDGELSPPPPKRFAPIVWAKPPKDTNEVHVSRRDWDSHALPAAGQVQQRGSKRKHGGAEPGVKAVAAAGGVQRADAAASKHLGRGGEAGGEHHDRQGNGDRPPHRHAAWPQSKGPSSRNAAHEGKDGRRGSKAHAVSGRDNSESAASSKGTASSRQPAAERGKGRAGDGGSHTHSELAVIKPGRWILASEGAPACNHEAVRWGPTHVDCQAPLVAAGSQLQTDSEARHPIERLSKVLQTGAGSKPCPAQAQPAPPTKAEANRSAGSPQRRAKRQGSPSLLALPLAPANPSHSSQQRKRTRHTSPSRGQAAVLHLQQPELTSSPAVRGLGLALPPSTPLILSPAFARTHHEVVLAHLQACHSLAELQEVVEACVEGFDHVGLILASLEVLADLAQQESQPLSQLQPVVRHDCACTYSAD